MEKMFKRTVLGTAIAFAAISSSANAAIDLHGEAVQLYGQAAGNIAIKTTKHANGEDSIIADLESRIGFRGTVEFDDFAPNLIWQIESGNANSGSQGFFGFRDTFVGLDFDNVGSFKFGRQLVAAYNYIDWPHSNPGLGSVFDYNNDLTDNGTLWFEDRANNVLRFDSDTWNGFNFQATASGMASTVDALVISVAGSYTQEMFSVHAGYYNQDAYVNSNNINAGDNSYYIVGGSLFLGDITLTAAFKSEENSLPVNKITQDSWSTTAQYVLDGTYVFKLGYAGTSDSKGRAIKYSDGDTAVTGRLGYLLPSTYLYFDVRYYDMASLSNLALVETEGTNFLLGAEYYF